MILKEEGLTGFWKGMTPGLLLYTTYSAAQFTFYSQPWLHDRLSPFWSGAIAASGATLITYPFDLVRTTMAMQSKHQSTMKILETLLSIGGPVALYRGVGATLIQVVPAMAVNFAFYEKFKHLLGDTISGAMAGALSKTIVMPIDVLRKRLQLGTLSIRASPFQPQIMLINKPAGVLGRNLVAELVRIWYLEGLRGLWSGWTMAVIKAAPVTAVTFGVYGACMRLNNKEREKITN